MQAHVIVAALGGQRVLGKRVKNSADLAKLDLGSLRLSRKLGIPQRTLTRRVAQGSRLTAAESDRTMRFARIFAHAVEMIGNEEKAVEWLRTPNRALNGERPVDALDTDPGSRDVEDILGRI